MFFGCSPCCGVECFDHSDYTWTGGLSTTYRARLTQQATQTPDGSVAAIDTGWVTTPQTLSIFYPWITPGGNGITYNYSLSGSGLTPQPTDNPPRFQGIVRTNTGGLPVPSIICAFDEYACHPTSRRVTINFYAGLSGLIPSSMVVTTASVHSGDVFATSIPASTLVTNTADTSICKFSISGNYDAASTLANAPTSFTWAMSLTYAGNYIHPGTELNNPPTYVAANGTFSAELMSAVDSTGRSLSLLPFANSGGIAAGASVY